MDTLQVIAQNLYQEDLYHIPGRVVVVIPNDWEKVAENDRTVLIRMINAVKLNFAAVQVVQRERLSANDLEALSPDKILSFGVPVTPMPNLYELTSLGGIPHIAADRLDLLDDARKKTLWGTLKQMFAL